MPAFDSRQSLLWGTFAVAGLALTGHPGLTGDPPSLGLVACGFLGLALAVHVWSGSSKFTPLSVLLVLTGLAAFVSCLDSLCPFWSSQALAAFLAFVLSWWASQFVVGDADDYENFSFGLLGLLSMSQAYALILLRENSGLAKGNFTNPDCYAVVCSLAFFIALGFCVHSQRAPKAIYLIVLTLSSVCLLLTGSRSGALGLIGGLTIFILRLWLSDREKNRNITRKLLVVPPFLILTALLLGDKMAVVSKFSELAKGGDQLAVKTRLDVVKYGRSTARRYAARGCGIGCFSLAYQQDRPSLMVGEDYMNVAHNDYVQWVVEIGWGGAGCFFLILGWSFRSFWRTRRVHSSWAAAQNGAITALCVEMAFNPACPVPSVLIWVGVVFGAGQGLLAVGESSYLLPRRSPRSLLFGSLILGASFWTAGLGWKTWQVTRLEKQSQRMTQVLDWEGAFGLLQDASNLAPDNPELLLSKGDLAHNIYLVVGESKWLKLEEEAYRGAVASSPRYLKALITLARSLEDQGKAEDATAYLDSAASYAPYSPHVKRGIARNQIFLGRPELAAKTLSSLKETGFAVDDEALAELISYLEIQKAGSGLAYLPGDDPKRTRDVARLTVEKALKKGQFECAIRLGRLFRKGANDSPDLQFLLAAAYGQKGDVSKELTLLEELRRSPGVDGNERLLRLTWQRWAQIRFERRQFDLVTHQLEDFLIIHPTEHWARMQLSNIQTQLGRKAEARAALRSGLPYDEAGTLHIALGDLCVAQGLPELARTYYQEALSVYAKPQEIRKKLEQIPSAETDENEAIPYEEVATPTPTPAARIGP